ncbi:MAG TPA: DUF6642 family protein [Flavobacterium sp.]|jgi:hypothetical protein
MSDNKYIFCLEVVPDVETETPTDVLDNLEQLAFEHEIDSIYKTCDSVEGLQESLNALLYEDHNFKHYEIIYLVMEGDSNNVRINDYFYSLEEIAEIFEGRMKAKIIHFSNAKMLDLSQEEAQYFLDVTGARAISGYGSALETVSSGKLDKAFFSLCQDNYDVVEIVETLHERHYGLCKMLDFRLYY